jgi:hypothetical protein
MITREELIREINKLPETYLEELYKLIKDFEVSKKEGESGESVMAKLRRIKISASPDFSTKVDLYSLKGQDAK